MDRELQDAVETAKSRIEDMSMSSKQYNGINNYNVLLTFILLGTSKKYLFHCREEFGRVAKVNERFTGRLEQLLQRQLIKVSINKDQIVQQANSNVDSIN